MPCYHPLKGYIVGSDPFTGKYKIEVKGTEDKPLGRQYIDIPCGKCLGCRIEYSRQWATRMMLELQDHESAYFVTLTYSNRFLDEHKRWIPIDTPITLRSGEYIDQIASLDKRDWQLFMKRLRDKVKPQKLRFFMCGEYGGQTSRAHMHAIIYGLKLDDLVPYKRNEQGQMMYNSPFLESVWTADGDDFPIGFVVVAPVTWETCAYVARYVVKKWMNDDLIKYDLLDIQSPFVLMSRRPGIGRNWFEAHADSLDFRFINLSDSVTGRKVGVPKYFKRLSDQAADKLMYKYGIPWPMEESILKNHKAIDKAVGDRIYVEKVLGLNYLDYLKQEEYNFKHKVNTLKRNGVDGDS